MLLLKKLIRRNLDVLILTAICGIYIYFIRLFWEFTTDDAFISMRYARNFVEGHGLVYNIGERVEGYSNFLWVFLLALFGKMGFDLIQTSKTLGALSGMGAIIFVALISFKYIKDRLFKLLPPLFLALFPGYVYYSVAGLETVFMAFLIILGTYLLLREIENSSVFPFSLGVFILGALTRPEGIVIFLLAWGLRIFFNREDKNKVFAEIKIGSIYLLVFMFFVVWKYYYYDSVIPNTCIAKSPGTINVCWIYNIKKYYAPFVNHHGGLILFVFIFYYFSSVDIRRKKWFLAINSITMAYLFLTLYGASGFWWMKYNRYLIPALPLIYFMVSMGIALFAEKNFGNATSLIFVLVLICGYMVPNIYEFHDNLKERYLEVDSAMNSQVSYEGVGKWLAANTEDDAVIYSHYIGAIGYFSMREIFDFYGLIDREIARKYKDGGVWSIWRWDKRGRERLFEIQGSVMELAVNHKKVRYVVMEGRINLKHIGKSDCYGRPLENAVVDEISHAIDRGEIIPPYFINLIKVMQKSAKYKAIVAFVVGKAKTGDSEILVVFERIPESTT